MVYPARFTYLGLKQLKVGFGDRALRKPKCQIIVSDQVLTQDSSHLDGLTGGQVSKTGSVHVVELPIITDPRGDLTFVEGGRHLPFEIRRVYYLYNVPVDSSRGGHAHRELEQVVFALSGSFRVTVDDGHTRSEHILRNPRQGLYISRLIWREMDLFSQGAVCMVLASQRYDEADYYRNYDDFQKAVREAS